MCDRTTVKLGEETQGPEIGPGLGMPPGECLPRIRETLGSVPSTVKPGIRGIHLKSQTLEGETGSLRSSPGTQDLG